jgi:hypothetical protein
MASSVPSEAKVKGQLVVEVEVALQCMLGIPVTTWAKHGPMATLVSRNG